MKTYYAYRHVEYDTYLGPEFAYEPFSMTYYNVEELIDAGQGTSTSLDQVALELLILEGILPKSYYESDNDDDYLEEEDVAALIKEHNIEIIVV